MISKKALDLIVNFEVSSKATYEKKYQAPEWPGEKSGVTVGIGYDLGYQDKEIIQKDWQGYLPQSVVDQLKSVSGIKGETARKYANNLKEEGVRVPWNAAYSVFEATVIPRWEQTVQKALPNTDKLSRTCFGVLVSLAYNRGASFSSNGDRYKEMREIKTYMTNKEFDKIPDAIRRMKRLWPNTKGLQIRRDKEADLFKEGLKESLNSPLVAATAGAVIAAPVAIAATPVDYTPYVFGAFAAILLVFIVYKFIKG